MKAELTSLVTRRSGSPSITGWKALPGWEGCRLESGSLESWRTKTTVPPWARQWASSRPTLASQSGLLRVPHAGSWKPCWTSTSTSAARSGENMVWTMLGCSRERQARDVPVQALGAEDARAHGRAGGGRRRPPLRHPGAPRHAPALGPAPGARRRAGLLRDPQRPARGAQGQPPRRAHRGPPARVPGVRGRDPQGRVRRRNDARSGTAAPTRCSSGAAQDRGRACTASACRGATRCSRSTRTTSPRTG